MDTSFEETWHPEAILQAFNLSSGLRGDRGAMLRIDTSGDHMKPIGPIRNAMLEIDGDVYLNTAEVVERLGISRQTL